MSAWRPTALREAIVQHWPVAALLCPLVFAAIAPASLRYLPTAQFMTLAQLPVAMAHQADAHLGGRLEALVNARLGAGTLSPEAVAVANLLGVWGGILASFLAGALVHAGWGLAACHLVLLIGLAHVLAAMVRRAGHPGLPSAAVLLLPAGVLGIALVGAAPGVGLAHHAVGLLMSLGLVGGALLHLVRGARG
jgi:hypothetical protein